MTETTVWRDALRRRVRIALRLLARGVDHEDVVAHAKEQGLLSGRFLFMVAMSCAIATLGLLLSSPAVIIGAMLISPLMGPIMLMGFSLSLLDLPALRRAMLSMGCGVVAAIVMSFLIVKLSPLSQATPEILARTRPNLFDLLVAIFSGLAGGYAVIQRKGETIVGVAIATALMPPLAVTGYGLAVGSMPVAGGSFFLFMTNLLAIALSVTVLARLFSFGAEYGSRGRALWQSLLVLGVFAGLSVPLGFALRDIAYETNAVNTIRAELTEPFETGSARVSDLSVSFPRRAPVSVQATIMTRTRQPEAEVQLQASLSNALGRPVALDLDQVLVDEDKALEVETLLQMADSSLAAPLRADIQRLEVYGKTRQSAAELRQSVPFTLAAGDIDGAARTATLVAAPQDGLSVSAYRAIEAGLARNYPDWTLRVVPPVSELPLITFETGEATLSEAGEAVLDDSLWALERWSIGKVEVVGYASTAGALQRFDNQSLAYRRAQTVAERLTAQGFEASAVGEYRAFRQNQDERNLGYQRFQSVLIRPEA